MDTNIQRLITEAETLNPGKSICAIWRSRAGIGNSHNAIAPGYRIICLVAVIPCHVSTRSTIYGVVAAIAIDLVIAKACIDRVVATIPVDIVVIAGYPLPINID